MGRYTALSVVLAACGTWESAEAKEEPASMTEAELMRYCDTHQRVKWEPGCKVASRAGCKAGGLHHECQFCGSKPWVPCEAVEETTPTDPTMLSPDQLRIKCGTPTQTVEWDKSCLQGGIGCRAGGAFKECRFCGFGIFSDCKTGLHKETTSSELLRNPEHNGDDELQKVHPGSKPNNEDTIPTDPVLLSPDQLKVKCGTFGQTVEWDRSCLQGGMGCRAGGKFHECRFCGFSPFSDCKETTSSVLLRNSEHNGNDELQEVHPGPNPNNEETKKSEMLNNLEHDGYDELPEFYPGHGQDNEENTKWNSEHDGYDELPEFYPGHGLDNEGTETSTGSANWEYDGDDELPELYPELYPGYDLNNEETNVAFKLGAPPKISS